MIKLFIEIIDVCKVNSKVKYETIFISNFLFVYSIMPIVINFLYLSTFSSSYN